MTILSATIIAIVSLIFSALFSGSEIAFITSDRVSVEIGIKKGGLLSRIIDKFYDHQSLFITTILVGNNIMLVIYGMGAAYLLNLWFINDWETSEAVKLIVETLISTFVVLLVGEFFPKATFRINPFKSLKLIALPLYVFYIVLWPISKFTEWLSKTLMKLMHVKNDEQDIQLISIRDLNQYIEKKLDSRPDDKPVENEVNFFHNAIDFSTTKVRDCMTPRNEVVAVNFDTATTESLRELFTRTGRSKILLFREDIDNIIGYIHVSEMLVNSPDIAKAYKEVIFVPETYYANKLLRRLLAEKRSIAIVIDEFGGTAGVITLEDLVEEIFGNIEDEHDKSSTLYKRVNESTYDIRGRAEISQLNDELHLNIPENNDDYVTVAGYIISNTGNIPEVKEVINLNGIEYTILEKSATRIESVRARILNEKTDED